MAILEACPDIKLNCDISHWIVVCERLFKTEDWWPKMFEILVERSRLIHARVSTTQQIQISDPELPENKEFVDFFMEVWFGILKDK